MEPEKVELEAALELLRQRALRGPSARARRKQSGSKWSAAAADAPRGMAPAKAKSTPRDAKAPRAAGPRPRAAAAKAGSAGLAAGDPKPKRPLSAYLRFCGQERVALQAEQPELKPSEARPCIPGQAFTYGIVTGKLCSGWGPAASWTQQP